MANNGNAKVANVWEPIARAAVSLWLAIAVLLAGCNG